MADDGALREGLERYALDNALKHEGKASEKAVMGKIMAERADLRARSKELMAMLAEIVARVNAMSPSSQQARLDQLGAVVVLERKRREGLQELSGAVPVSDGGKGVVMRLAPGPSGPLHLGHSRMAILNDEYVKVYGGKLIDRLEDTDVERILPEAYDWIPEDIEWLGVKVHETVRQSDRFAIYMDIAKQLVARGAAYVCTCQIEEWKKLLNTSRPCAHRDQGPDVQMGEWEKMVDGTYAEGQAVLVIKTDLGHKNPAVRDWYAMRIVDSVPHPLTGSRYRIYPLMNFSVAIDDHLMGLTHVLRGKDHLNNTHRQEYLYDHMGWSKPVFIHYGRVTIEDILLSKRKILAGIQAGEYTGWDDVRLGTLRAMRRRGIRPEAIRKYWVDAGVKQVDITFSWKNLYAANKDIIDPESDRFYFVWDPVPLTVDGAPPDLAGRSPYHPDIPSRGMRVVPVPDGRVLVTAEDLSRSQVGDMLRLKDLCNVRIGAINGTGTSVKVVGTYEGNDLAVLKQGAHIIHWVHPTENIEARVLMPDGTSKEGRCEVAVAPSRDAGRMVQFERFGFTRLVPNGGSGKVQGVFAHR